VRLEGINGVRIKRVVFVTCVDVMAALGLGGEAPRAGGSPSMTMPGALM
jgi:hypothetical protein